MKVAHVAVAIGVGETWIGGNVPLSLFVVIVSGGGGGIGSGAAVVAAVRCDQTCPFFIPFSEIGRRCVGFRGWVRRRIDAEGLVGVVFFEVGF